MGISFAQSSLQREFSLYSHYKTFLSKLHLIETQKVSYKSINIFSKLYFRCILEPNYVPLSGKPYLNAKYSWRGAIEATLGSLVVGAEKCGRQ